MCTGYTRKHKMGTDQVRRVKKGLPEEVTFMLKLEAQFLPVSQAEREVRG